MIPRLYNQARIQLLAKGVVVMSCRTRHRLSVGVTTTDVCACAKRTSNDPSPELPSIDPPPEFPPLDPPPPELPSLDSPQPELPPLDKL